jgi:glycosyltransferase involved in cell wall biosynthesis
MNILLVTETYLPYITGVSISTDSIARFMISRGHKVTLVCPKPLVKGVVTPTSGLKTVCVPSLPFAYYNLNATAIFPLALPAIGKLMCREKFDVVHIQEPGAVGIAALINAKTHHIPVVGALHFIPEQIDRVLWGSFEKVLTPLIDVYIRIIYNKYDAIMTPSHFFAGYLKRNGVKKPIKVVSNGTDIKKFHPAPRNNFLRKSLGFSDNDFVFFFLGRIDRDKNVETLIRAMPGANRKIKLLIVGRGDEKRYLQGLAVKLKVSERIAWIKYITNGQMPGYYHSADAFLIMSPFEGQSIVTLQAAASGLPIIAAKAAALPELCHNGKNGFLVDTYDFKALAEKMNELEKDKNLQKRFCAQSRKISLPHDKPKALHNLELLYQNLATRF